MIVIFDPHLSHLPAGLRFNVYFCSNCMKVRLFPDEFDYQRMIITAKIIPIERWLALIIDNENINIAITIIIKNNLRHALARHQQYFVVPTTHRTARSLYS